MIYVDKSVLTLHSKSMEWLRFKFTGSLKSHASRMRILFFTLLVFLILSLLFLSFYIAQKAQNRQIVVDELSTQEQAFFEIASLSIEDSLQHLAGDLFILADYTLSAMENSSHTSPLQEVDSLYTNIVMQHRLYDAISVLNNEGQEILRVNSSEEGAVTVAEDELQDKADRDYVQATQNLHSREIYLSPIDLSMENGRIEIPYKPILRIATPLVSSTGERQGMIVVNYLADTILSVIREATEDYPSDFFLVNKDGYYLINDRSPSLEFSFMFPRSTAEGNLAAEKPELAALMKQQEKGNLVQEDGLYIFSRIHPYTKIASHFTTMVECSDCSENYAWTIISFYPDSYVDSLVNRRLLFNDIELIPVFLLIILLSIFIGIFWFQRSSRSRFITSIAREDQLTGALSRAWGMKRIEKLLHESLSESQLCAFLFMDLDRFKEVNDTYGHKVGDEVLHSFSQRVKNLIRGDDMLIRLGGDEFLLVLSFIHSREEVSLIASRIHDKIVQPFTSQLTGKAIQLDCCMGAAVCPEDGTSVSDILSISDRAMYQAKQTEGIWYAEYSQGPQEEKDRGRSVFLLCI